jgi:hypothetical protein
MQQVASRHHGLPAPTVGHRSVARRRYRVIRGLAHVPPGRARTRARFRVVLSGLVSEIRPADKKLVERLQAPLKLLLNSAPTMAPHRELFPRTNDA